MPAAIQLRYRSEFAPLSELFLVYGRGGTEEQDQPERSLGSSLRHGLAEETDRRFLLKLHYHFPVLG